MSANERQIGGEHYGLKPRQHWDIVVEFGLGYFEGQITKYLFRWRQKNGLQDLKKAAHYLEKLIEVEEARNAAHPVMEVKNWNPGGVVLVDSGEPQGRGYVDQDGEGRLQNPDLGIR